MQGILVVVFMVILVWLLLKGFRTDSKNERNETKICPHCGSRIPYNASVCRYCHSRRLGIDWSAEGRLFKNSFTTKLMLIALALMAICVVLLYLMGA